MKTIGSIIFGTMAELIDKRIIPDTKCPRCKTHYMFKDDVFCDWCVEDMVEGEG